MADLTIQTISLPVGTMNGQFRPWVTQWQLPAAAPNGFVIQHIKIQFQNVHYCGDDTVLSDEEIWNLFDYQGDPRFEYWEAWQYKDGLWQLPGSKDSWGFSNAGTFYSNDTEGIILFTGNAGFYEADTLDTFASGWGTNGDNQGSPMSGDLMSTIQPPNLPAVPLVPRTMTIEWHPCNCDSDDSACRKTTVSTSVNSTEIA